MSLLDLYVDAEVFVGFFCHFVINDCAELLTCQLMPGNVDDGAPVPELAQRLFGKLFADKGYILQALFELLFDSFGVQLTTGLRKNMKNRLMSLHDKLVLRKRAVVERVIDQPKNTSQNLQTMPMLVAYPLFKLFRFWQEDCFKKTSKYW